MVWLVLCACAALCVAAAVFYLMARRTLAETVEAVESLARSGGGHRT